jgi:hypothetical protein
MAISFVLHLVGPLAIATIFSSFLGGYPLSTRVWILIIGSMIFSFIVNFGALLFLQTTSCDGLKDAGGVAVGAGIGALITGFFMWIPSTWEGLRLSISQVFVNHQSLLTPTEVAQDNILAPASMRMLAIPSAPPAIEPHVVEIQPQTGGNRLTPEEYADQTFNEIKSALSYMAAFAGAYGVGIGSRYAVKCK